MSKTISRCSFAVLVSSLLAGCGADSTEQVKNTIIGRIDASITLGKALETRTDCIDATWSESVDKRDRTEVTYTCSLPENYLGYINHEHISRFEMDISQHIDKMKNAVSQGEIKNNQIDAEINRRSTNLEILEKNKTAISEFIAYAHNEKMKSVEQSSLLDPLSLDAYMQKLSPIFFQYALFYPDSTRHITEADFCNDDNVRNYFLAKQINGDISPYKELCKAIYPTHVAYSKLYSGSGYQDHGIFEDYIGRNLIGALSGTNTESEQSIRTLDLKGRINLYNELRDNVISTDNSYIEYYKKTLVNVGGLKKNIAHFEGVMQSKDKALSLTNVQVINTWRVTESGGVELLTGALNLNFADDDISFNLRDPEAPLAIAYQDFNDDDIPTFYIEAINNAMKNKITGLYAYSEKKESPNDQKAVAETTESPDDQKTVAELVEERINNQPELTSAQQQCVDKKMDAYRQEVGADAMIAFDQVGEWENECRS